MAASQKNFSLFSYTDDNAQVWNIRGEEEEVRNAVDGSSAAGGHPPFIPSRRHQPRRIVYRDSTTLRTKTCLFYTPTAYAAITVGTSTLSFFIEGEVAAVVYTATKKLAEKNPAATAGASLPDHA